MRGPKVDRAVLEIDDDPVERLRHDLHGLDAGNGRDRAEGRGFLPPEFFQAIERWQRCLCQFQTPAWSLSCRKLAVHAGMRPPKNGISALLNGCGRPEVKINSAPASSAMLPGEPSNSTTRRAIAGAGSIQATCHGASRTKRSISRG